VAIRAHRELVIPGPGIWSVRNTTPQNMELHQSMSQPLLMFSPWFFTLLAARAGYRQKVRMLCNS
jgi:hypothetical protein